MVLLAYRCMDKKKFIPEKFVKDLSCGTLKKKLNVYEREEISNKWCIFLKYKLDLCFSFEDLFCINSIGRDKDYLYIKFSAIDFFCGIEKFLIIKYRIVLNDFFLNSLNENNLKIPEINTKWRFFYEYDSIRSHEINLSESDDEY